MAIAGAQAYPPEIRARVLTLYDDGLTTKPIAARLMVSPAWARRVNQERDADPALRRPAGGRKPKLDRAGRDRLATWVAERPDATLEELRERVAAELGVTVSVRCLFDTLRAITLKKKGRSSLPSSSGRTWPRPATGFSPTS